MNEKSRSQFIYFVLFHLQTYVIDSKINISNYYYGFERGMIRTCQSILFLAALLYLFLHLLNYVFFCHTRMMDASEKMGYCYFLMVVRSESMKPSFHVGDILVSYSIHLDGYCSKQVNDNKIDEVLKKGDVVVLQVNIGSFN